METVIAEKRERRSNHGKAIRYMRELLNLSQEGLGTLVEMSQKQISRLENKKEIELHILSQIAIALNIPVQVLESFDPEEHLQTLIQNNENKDSSACTNINAGELHYENDPNILEMFERMIKEKDERIEELQKLLTEKEMIILQQKIEIAART